MDELEVADEREDNEDLINEVSRYQTSDKPDFKRLRIEPLPTLLVLLHQFRCSIMGC